MQRRALVGLNVVGGLAVLGSYLLTFARPDAGAVLWGGVPESWKGFYTTNMFLAAAGYFPFTWVLAVRADPASARFAGRFGYGALFPLYALVLVGSALWLPLTYAWADAPSTFAWLLVRVDLALVALGSLGLLACVLTVTPRPPLWLHVLALVGCLAFNVQTVVLDATLWPAWYPTP